MRWRVSGGARAGAATATAIGIVAVIAASAAVVALALLAPAPGPATLASPKPAATVPVTERTFDDARQAQLRLTRGAPRSVPAPRRGVLTSLNCAPGRPVASGSVVATIDGGPVIALATRFPLWRDLHPGDRGDDVSALQTELSRLGHATPADGIVGRSTLRAVAALRESVAPPGSGDRQSPSADTGDIVAAEFAWVPAPDAAVEGCTAVVGAPVAVGDALLRLPPEVMAARLTSVPESAAPGQRVVRLGGTELVVDGDGAVTAAEDLRRLAVSPEAAAAFADDSGAASLVVQWVLAHPIDALVVPPSALWDIRERHACLLSGSDDEPILVELAGSDLGQSFVVAPSGAPIRAVVTRPSTARSCR